MPRRGAVDRARRPVVAILGEDVGIEIEPPAVVGLVARKRLRGSMRRAEQRVDGTARRDARILPGGDGNVAVRVEPLAGAAVAPVVRASAAEDRHGARALRAALE